MKKQMVIFLLTFLLMNIYSFGQEIEKITLDDYSNFLKKSNKKITSKEVIKETDIKLIAKKIYLAYRDNPVKIKKMYADEEYKIRKQCQGDKTKYRELFNKKKSIVEKKLFEILRTKLDTVEYNLLKTDLLVQGTILKKELIERPVSDLPHIKVRMVYLRIRINDIILGNSLIKRGDEIDIYYSPNWLSSKDPKWGKHIVNWDESKTYLFNLLYRDTENKHEQLSIITRHGYLGYFPFERGSVIDYINYFKLGKSIEWNNFKNNINQRIENITN